MKDFFEGAFEGLKLIGLILLGAIILGLAVGLFFSAATFIVCNIFHSGCLNQSYQQVIQIQTP